MTDPDGAGLLTGPQVEGLLVDAVLRRGGTLVGWSLDHVDQDPGRSTTATFRARVAWPHGERDEMLGIRVSADGPDQSDIGADLVQVGDREMALWLYPDDPGLPGLARVAFPERLAALLADEGIVPGAVGAEDLGVSMVTYRPRRRAVLKVQAGGQTLFVKVLRPDSSTEMVARHELLREGGVPVPEVLCTTPDHLVVLAGLGGDPLARAMFNPEPPCTAEQLVDLLDGLPLGVTRLERRRPWADAVAHYAEVVAAALPEEQRRLHWLAETIEQGLAGVEMGDEPTHGDFHEGQVHVAGGRIVGLLDVDTCGPGRRADDLACLVAHLSTVQRMNLEQADRVNHLLRTWVPVFDERVDAHELRLRAAAVVVSLATGPYRSQEGGWQRSTSEMLDTAEALVRQVS